MPDTLSVGRSEYKVKSDRPYPEAAPSTSNPTVFGGVIDRAAKNTQALIAIEKNLRATRDRIFGDRPYKDADNARSTPHGAGNVALDILEIQAAMIDTIGCLANELTGI